MILVNVHPILFCFNMHFLNQVCTGLQLVQAWFLEIAFVRKVGVCMCVCVSAPEGINNYLHEMNP